MTSSNSPLPVEPVVRYPLQTRATISSSVVNDNSNWISRLANYFDTSNIEIPMPPNPPKAKRTYRRKQKLETIDLNNSNEFVLQNIVTSERRESKKERDGPLTFVAIKNIENEVDEIFRQRKKRRTVPATKESDSDSDEIPLKLIKTHKCPNCKKMYKTPKTLGQHLKKCSSAPVVSSTTEANAQGNILSPMIIKDEYEGIFLTRSLNNIYTYINYLYFCRCR